jgi:hypothetical protein
MEKVFNNPDLYPTPEATIIQMLDGIQISGKIFLEPSAGKGNIVEYLLNMGSKNVLSCENNEELKKILQTKCNIIESDFFNLTSDKISHIDAIIMNPPFSNADKHILHAWSIAPDGCKIISLCNSSTLENAYSKTREQLKSIIEENGSVEDLGDCFNESERKTGVNVSLIKLIKPGASYKSEFEGFFMDEDEPEQHGNALMSYNVVRDLVNRYVAAVKIYDEQLSAAIKMNELTSGFYSSGMGMNISKDKAPISRNEFKKEMQKSGWNFVFEKMNMGKYATRGLKEDINKFVEQQENIPFTMKNIYRMLEIVIGTQSQRMDKALLEVFEKVTERCHENRYNLPGWKTNSHYLLTEKFIIDNIVKLDYYGKMDYCYNGYIDIIEDMQKALCYITGTNYDECTPLTYFINNIKPMWGQWVCWGFFEIRGYKKGTMHFKFQNPDLWGKFNQHISRIKGYPIYEHTKREEKKTNDFYNKTKPTILETIEI